MGYADRQRMWFGTEEYSKWVKVPLSGADLGSVGFESGGTYTDGTGYQYSSGLSHRETMFEWGPSSTYEEAQEMLDFANGSYGLGGVYYTLPTAYDKNVLPSAWATPHDSGLYFGGALTSAFNATGSTYPRVSSLLTGTSKLYIPVPEGYDLVIGLTGSYTALGGGSVRATPRSLSGVDGTPRTLTAIADITGMSSRPMSQWPVVVDRFSSVSGVTLGPSTALISAMCARLIPSSHPALPAPTSPWSSYPEVMRKPWVGGMGSGPCRFTSKPSLNLSTGWGGGSAGFAVSLKEVTPPMSLVRIL